MPSSAWDDTFAFNEEAAKKFRETFESGRPMFSHSLSDQKDSQQQQKKIKQLEADNATLRFNLKSAESRLSEVLTENTRLKESLKELKELSRLSPVKAHTSSEEKELVKPYIKEIQKLKEKLLFYENIENLDTTRIVRYTPSNPYDEAVKKRESKENKETKKRNNNDVKSDSRHDSVTPTNKQVYIKTELPTSKSGSLNNVPVSKPSEIQKRPSTSRSKWK